MGSWDQNAYVFDSEKDFRLHYTCIGNTSSITKLTFSLNSSVLKTNSKDGAIIAYDVQNKKRQNDTKNMRDVDWADDAMFCGWSTQGVWAANKHLNLSDIPSIAHYAARAQPNDAGVKPKLRDPFVVVGEAESCELKVFPYPATLESTEYTSYTGHCQAVLNVVCHEVNEFKASLKIEEGPDNS